MKAPPLRAAMSALPVERALSSSATLFGAPYDGLRDISPGGSSSRGPHSRLAISTCDMQWALRYFFHLRPSVEKLAADKGTVFHLGVAYHYAARTPEPPPWFGKFHMKDELEKALRAWGSADREVIREEARARHKAYLRWARGEDFVPLFVEREMVATISEAFGGPDDDIGHEIITARKDLVARVGGRLTDVDLKSKAGHRSKQELFVDWREYARDRQILENVAISRARFDERVDSFLIRRAKREPPFAFRDEWVRIDWRALKEGLQGARRAVKNELRVAERAEAGKKIRENGLDTNACHSGFTCDYYDVCAQVTKADRLVQIGKLSGNPANKERALRCFGG